jgi:hypothetical protein
VSVIAAAEAMRITRTIESSFPTGPPKRGSAFVAADSGQLLTCAHVVMNDARQCATRVLVEKSGAPSLKGTVSQMSRRYDLARIEVPDAEPGPRLGRALPDCGESVVFAGKPQGVARPSVFPGMVSAAGPGLLTRPRCDLI